MQEALGRRARTLQRGAPGNMTQSVQHIPVFHPLLPFNSSAFPKICDFPQNRVFLTTVLYLNLYEISNKYSLRNPFCGAYDIFFP